MSFSSPTATRKSPLLHQRKTVRYQCAPATTGRLFSPGDTEFTWAWIKDISTRGLGLLLPRPLDIDQQIVIQVRSASTNQKLDLTGQVRHVTVLPSREWLIGCEFATPLTEETLDDLL